MKSVGPNTVLRIESDADIVTARWRGRELAAKLGFGATDQALIATAISEVARNILVYAKRGEIAITEVTQGDRHGILVVASDRGPGIEDVSVAMRDGYSTGGSLGLGLPGAKRLMDEFEIESEVGLGTTITLRKWKR